MAGSTENLIANFERTPEEREEIARKGGIASGEARREKKLLSKVYADALAELNDLPEGERLSDTIKAIIQKKSPHSVSMLKEIREATEGSNIKLTGDAELPLTINIIGVSAST
jgi:hypothetical protein